MGEMLALFDKYDPGGVNRPRGAPLAPRPKYVKHDFLDCWYSCIMLGILGSIVVFLGYSWYSWSFIFGQHLFLGNDSW